MTSRRILFVANGWEFLFAYRSHLIEILHSMGWEVHLAAPGLPPSGADRYRVTHHSLNLSRESRNPGRELLSAAEFVSLLRSVRPTAVEASTIKPVVYTALAARMVHVPRVVLWCAGLGMSSPSSATRLFSVGRAVQLVLRGVRGRAGWTFVAENAADVEFLRRGAHVAGRDVRMIRGRGVTLSEFKPGTSSAKTIDVLFAGRFLRSKGVVEFVDAVRIMKKDSPSLRFALAGAIDSGNPDSVDSKQVEAWRAEEMFSFLGSTADMPGMLAATRILCFPSTYGEGAPRIVMEAASAGLPLVCVDSPAMAGLVQNDETGILTDGSPEELARACLSLLHAPDRLARMGAAATVLANREFDSALALEQTLALYQ